MRLQLSVVFFGGLFLLHALEEYVTSFYAVDPSTNWLANLLGTTPITVWFLAQLLLAVFFLLLYQFGRYKAPWVVLLALVFFELSHVVPAVADGRYYPGLFTALIILAFSWLPIQVFRTLGISSVDRG